MSEKILIIEDEEKIARFIELELSHEGYETTKVFNGRMGETNIVDVYIYYLRNKIDDVFNDKIIRTVRGVGYIIK